MAGFGLAVLLLLMSTAGAFYVIDQFLTRSREAVRHARIVVPLETTLVEVHEVEATQRGYLVTGAPHFLQQRENALRHGLQAMHDLRAAAAGDRDLLDQVDQIERLVRVRLESLDSVLRVASSDLAAARRLLTQGTGREEMEQLSAAVGQLASRQNQLLQRSADEAEQQSRPMRLLLAAALVFGALALAALLHLIRRGLADRERAHAALADERARLDAVLDTAVDAIVVIDDHGVIQRVNHSAERMFGYRADELVGHNVNLLVPDAERAAHDEHLARYRRTGERRIIGHGREVVAQRKDGTLFPAELAVGETQVHGQRLFTGLVRDVTERRRAQQRQQELMQQLQAANEELGNFAYVASHDLKAPLRAIGSLAQWIAADQADRLDDQGREHLALMLGRVHRMNALIDGILQYSRVGRVKEAPDCIDLDELLHETVDLLAPPPHVQVQVDPLPSVRMERARAQQLFQNLIGNAIRYNDKAQGEVRVACRADGDMLHFTVADNGPGIERRHWDRVFQLFQSLQPRDQTESTGIGLSLVKKIVELHRGRVWLESEPGRGATFHVTLPKALQCT